MGKRADEMIDFGVTEHKARELHERMAACGLREADIQEKFVRSGGPGGQKVNKVSTCVYLKHQPSSLEVKMQNSRSQGLNRFYARRRLCELLEEKIPGLQSQEETKRQKLRKQKDRRRRRRKKTSE
jgi:protein subunit release factor B